MRDYLLMDKRVHLVYVVVLCALLGLILPSIISFYLGEYQADLGNCNPPTIYKSVPQLISFFLFISYLDS